MFRNLCALKNCASLALILALTACGGGGGGGPATGPVASSNVFNLDAAYRAYVASGESFSFPISGSCSGTLQLTTSPANFSTNFEGQTALASTQVAQFTFNACSVSSVVNTFVNFYTPSYTFIGTSAPGTNYGVVPGFTLPTAAMVGSAGTGLVVNLYQDSNKAVYLGHTDYSFVVRADTSTTVLFDLISKDYNQSALVSTQTQTFRLDGNNSLKTIAVDIQLSNGTHFVAK